MSNWFEALSDSVQQSFGQAIVFKAGSGRLLFSPCGARLAACEMSGVDENLFWHHPDALDPQKLKQHAASILASLGGDRLWIAPEVGYFWTDLKAARIDPHTSTVIQPSMDSGDYRIAGQSSDHVQMTAQMALHDYRTGRDVTLRVNRYVGVTDELVELPQGVTCSSFLIRNDVTLLEADDEAVGGAWDLLQVPPVGTLICPTTTPVEQPRSYYNPYGDRHVVCDESSIRFLIDGMHRIKMGLSPQQTTGRMGYYRQLEHVSSLIVRIFAALPGEPYVDLPRSSDATFGGDALQAYNDDGNAGGFGEMEYHDPAVVAGRSPDSRSGSCVTHVLVGPDDAVRKVGEELLGVAIIPID